MKLNTRHATAKAMPTVARMAKMIVRERCTDTASSLGTPSYGIPSRKGIVGGNIWQYIHTNTLNVLHFLGMHMQYIGGGRYLRLGWHR